MRAKGVGRGWIGVLKATECGKVIYFSDFDSMHLEWVMAGLVFAPLDWHGMKGWKGIQSKFILNDPWVS